jgi:hypothetical protein
VHRSRRGTREPTDHFISEVLRCPYQEFTTRCHQLAPAGALGSAKNPSSPNVNCTSAMAS